MSKHFFLIDPLEKLNPKKDTTLLLMLTLQEMGVEVYGIMKEDLFLTYPYEFTLQTHQLFGRINPDSFYLEEIQLKKGKIVPLEKLDTIHMRLDPPFDEMYLKTLWALNFFQTKGINVLNNPQGILTINEKLSVFGFDLGDYPFILSGNVAMMKEKVLSWKKDLQIEDLVIKPINLFQGYGVVKVSVEKFLEEDFHRSMNWKDYWMVLPFFNQIYQGEYRCVFFKGELLGSIKKVPPKGSFLANIAQGASFEVTQIPETLKAKLVQNTLELEKSGIIWVAYDCIGEHVSEINVTCPGLLVELAHAHRENLALKIAKYFK